MSDTDKKKNWFARHKILTVIIAVIVIAAIASSSGDKNKNSSSTNSGTSQSNTKQEEKKAETVAKLNEPARDGKFEFTVKKVECGRTTVGTNQYLQKTAQGQYCFVTLSVKNIGDTQQYFSESDQKLLNASNQQYSADSTATLYNSNNSDVFLSQINPGNTVEGVLVYDIPKDQTPVTAELHDSGFSSGVRVKLQ